MARAKAFDGTDEALQFVDSSLAVNPHSPDAHVFRIESGPLKEVLDRIEERANYGDMASGRYLTDEFAKEPFGWDFEVIRLLALSLLRAGAVQATSKGQTFDTATGPEAKTMKQDINTKWIYPAVDDPEQILAQASRLLNG